MEITLKHISKRFGTTIANDDISLTFEVGRIVGILGENGAGKSTLMKILSGYQAPDTGEIWLDARRVVYHNPKEAVANGVGMLQQDPLDVGAFSVLENFTFGNASLRTLAQARQSLAGICARFGFALDPDALTSQLSIAERQQLEIARLLALGVRLLILDEPTTGISASQKRTLFTALRELAQDGMTILLVSHKLEDVLSLCHEVVVLRSGRVVDRATMPTTPEALVRMMFGELNAHPPRHTADEGEPVLRLSGRLHSPRYTVEISNFTLRRGETVGLAGLDGSGQELFLRALVGLVKPQRGSLWLNGRDHTTTAYRDLLREGVFFGAVGRIEEGLIGGMTITEHLALVYDTHATIRWQDARARALERIARYNIRGTPESPLNTLSGGNQQRVLMSLIADALNVLALEQPTRGLDLDSARWIWETLEERRKAGAGIVFSSAELDEILAYSDRILVFFEGRITEITDISTVTVEKLGQLIGGGEAK